MPRDNSPEFMRKIGPKKGEVRNPKGRPRGIMDRKTAFAWLLNDATIAEIMGIDEKKAEEYARKIGVPKHINRAQMLTAVAYSKAIKGDLKAAEMIFDGVFGKTEQAVKHGGDADNPIKVFHKIDDAEILKRYINSVTN